MFLIHFWSNFFPIFGAKRNFLDNLVLSHTTSYEFLVTCQNLEKTNDTIPSKRPDRQKDRQKDRWKD